MKTSQAGLAHIAQEEGEVLHTYIDVAGKPTIGVGHLLRPGESFPNGITKEQSRALLAQDVSIAESHVNTLVKVPMTQNMFDALVSFTFNCGGGALKTSSILKFTNAGDLQAAAEAFMLWNKTTDPKTGQLVVNKGLTNRRIREKTLFLKPDAAAPVVVPPKPVVEEPKPEPVKPEPTPVQPELEPQPEPVEPPKPVEPPVPPPAPIVPVKETVPAWKALVDFILMLLKAFFGGKK